MKPSAFSIRLERSSRLVNEAINLHGPAAADEVTAILTGYLEQGETVPDLRLTLALLSRWLVDSTRQMLVSDLANERELANDAPLRLTRDNLTSDLVSTMVSLKTTCREIYGPTRIEEIGFTEQTPREPLVIMNVGKALVDMLEEPEFAFPEPRPLYARQVLQPEDMVAAVKPLVLELDEALDAVNKEVKKAQTTHGVKQEKAEAHKSSFRWIATFVEAMLRMAKMDHEADRIKPSARRPGQVENDVPEPPEEETVAEPTAAETTDSSTGG